MKTMLNLITVLIMLLFVDGCDTEREEKDFKNPPPRPHIERVYSAIELGNAEEVWSHVYYKTADINGGSSYIPWLHYAIVAEQREREKRIMDIVANDPRFAKYRGGLRPSSEVLVELYNMTKSTDFTAMIRMLIRNGADVNKISDDRTPLGLAVGGCNVDAIHMLIAAGADPNILHGTDSILTIAVRTGSLEIAKELLDHGAIVDLPGRRQSTPLSEAVERDDYAMTKLLLEKGANVNVPWKQTPLHIAVTKKNLSITRLLLEYGAYAEATASDGTTPISLARARNDSELTEILRPYETRLPWTQEQIPERSARGVRQISYGLGARDFLKYDGQQYKVDAVTSGDCLKLQVADGRKDYTVVRLWGVDTPEPPNPEASDESRRKGQPHGIDAKRFTEQLCNGRLVTLRLNPDETRDKFGRLLAYVLLPDNRILNREIIKDGRGFADPRWHHIMKSDCNRLQLRAMRERWGLWEDISDSELPQYYRGKLQLP